MQPANLHNNILHFKACHEERRVIKAAGMVLDLGLWHSTKRNETKQLVFNEMKQNETSTVTCEITGVPSSRYELVM